jgi:hypothetical protein
MKKSLCGLLIAGFVLVFATVLNAGSFEDQGKAWLGAQKEPAAINVRGIWDSEFGVLRLGQTEGSRDVNGSGGGYDLTGVVSGKHLYLLFVTHHGNVEYCAVLNSESDSSLIGDYHNRVTRLRLGTGLCQEKGRRLYMRKK